MSNFEDQWEEVSEDLPAEDVQEIIGVIPSNVTRWGISIVAGIFVFALLGSYLFKYPDIITTNASLITESPPAQIISKRNATIEELYVSSFDTVLRGKVLAKLESPISYTDISSLKNDLMQIDISDIDNVRLKQYSDLGDITVEYNELLSLIKDYSNFNNLNYYPKMISMFESKREIQNNINRKLINKKQYLEDRLDIEKSVFEIDSVLTLKDYTARKKFMSINSEYLADQAMFEDLLIDIENLQLEMYSTNEQILNNKKLQENETLNYQLKINEKIKSIEAKIESWEESNLLIAQQDGQIIFTSVWSEMQFVAANQSVFTIIPLEGGDIVARLNMPSFGSGKVKEGQKVVIKLDDYPYRKYGSLEGEIKSISKITEKDELNRSVYNVEVMLNNSMMTNYNQNLEFTQNMTGTADIITEENRLLEKIYLPIKDILHNNIQ
ncbi:MAG: HlyD family efflux transporter periplasmic adaptor subunit [Candidatus Kapaibacteriales bacterium]